MLEAVPETPAGRSEASLEPSGTPDSLPY